MSLFKPFDPFQDALDQETEIVKNVVDIRFFEHSKKRKTTSIEGFPDSFDFKDLITKLQPVLSCGGAVVKDARGKNVIKFQGDHREALFNYLISKGIVAKSNLRVH